MVRSCYEADWTPYPADPELTLRVRWYEVPWSRPVVPWTIFRSSNWDEWLDLFTPGERHKTATWCEPGPPLRMPLGTPGRCGTDEAWSGVLPFPPVGLPIDPATGVPFCCGPQYPGDPSAIAYGCDEEIQRHHAEAAAWVIAADDTVTTGDEAGTAYGAGFYETQGDEAATVYGAEDEIIDTHPDCPDLLAMMPAVRYAPVGGCGLDPWWMMPGSLSSTVQVQLGGWGNRIIWMPLPMPRERTLRAAAVHQGSFPFPGGQPFARMAIYQSAGERCGYPGALLADLGEVAWDSPGTRSFPAATDVVLPAGELLWVALWSGVSLYAGQLDTTDRGAPTVYPVIQFGEWSWFNAGVAWTTTRIYSRPGEGNWPDPPDAAADVIGEDGFLEPGHAPCGLPAIWLLLK